MFMASPQQWLTIFMISLTMYLITFSKISTLQPFSSTPQSHAPGKVNWKW